jgi:radical SAM additional 4Fe4S-binding domain
MDGLDYHVFKQREKYLMFITDTCKIYEINSLTYHVLLLYDIKSEEEIVAKLAPEYSREKIEEVFEELKVLEADIASCQQSCIRKIVPSDLANVHPKQLVLAVSQECNLGCEYCIVNKGEYGQKGKMSADTARRAVDYMLERSEGEENLIVDFFGGEPLLNFPVVKKTAEYIDQIRRKKNIQINMSITTNGTILNDEILDFFKQYHMAVIVSIDGPREIHDQWRKFRNGKGTHSVVTANIEMLVRSLPNVITARTTLTRQSPPLMEIGYYLEKMGFHDVQFSRVTEFPNCNSCGNHTYSELALSEQELTDMGEDYCQAGLSEIQGRSGRMKYSFRTGMLMRHMRYIKQGCPRRYNCGAGIGILGVGIQGDLYPCQYFIDMPVFKIGDVWKGIDTDRLADFYNTFNNNRQKCESCWVKNLCGRGCFFGAVKDGCRFAEPDEAECSIIRKYAEISLYLYTHIKRYQALDIHFKWNGGEKHERIEKLQTNQSGRYKGDNCIRM